MAQPFDKPKISGLSEARTEYGPSSDEELGPADRVERLRLAVEDAGGAPQVARLAGIALSTLKRFMEGQDPKFGAAIRLAQHLGVRLEWLATGTGPMRVGDGDMGLPDAGLDLESLVYGLNSIEETTPEADAPGRARGALKLHEALRRRETRNHPPATIDRDRFGHCLAFAEQLLAPAGNPLAIPARSRLRVALGAYMLAAQEADANKPDA